MTKFAHAYPATRNRVSLECKKGSSLTKQSMQDETDINKIVNRYQKTGLISFANQHAPQYDFASSQDYKSSMDIIATANSMFEELPSGIRTRFKNDPAAFLDYVQEPSNLPEMRELGLALPKPQEAELPPPTSAEPLPEPTGDPTA